MRRPHTLLFAALLLLGSAGLWPRAAWADARDDARRYFKAGMELIAAGSHAEGAARLQRAYDLLPHPSVLYNIGLAWADAGAYDKAIKAFEGYVDTNPGDSAAVERLLGLLKQQAEEVRSVGAPRPSEPTLPTEPLPSGTSGAPSTPEITALLDRLERLATRLESGEGVAPKADIRAEVPDAELLEAKGGDFLEDVVVSASRTASTPSDAPAATTIITAEEIRLSGATNVADVLRRVPGMSTLTMGAANSNLAIRGFNQRISNKLLVLVDGRSVYFDFLGGTFFRTLNVDLADIERIEVIRGPGSTLYGASAFGGVVNIITKAPGESEGGQVRLAGGNGETLQGHARFSGRKGIVGWRGSLGYEQTDRYALEFDGARQDLRLTVQDPTLALRALRFNGGVAIAPGPQTRIGFSGGLSYVFNNFVAIGVFRDFWMEGIVADLRADLQFGGLEIRAFWNVFDAKADLTWATVGGLDLSNSPKSHVVDVEAVYSGSLTLGARHDLSVGAGYRLKTIDWEWLDGPHLESHLNGFVEDRITFAPPVVAVLGFRFDQHPLVGFTPSPRGTLLLKPTPRQSFRISAGTAFRTPTFVESYLSLVIPSGVKGVALRSLGNTELRPENIFSVEAGYTFEDSDFLSFAINGYYERVTNLIALGSVVGAAKVALVDDHFIAGTSTWENNDGVFHGAGGEAEVHAFPIDGLDVRASYSLNLTFDQGKKEAGLTGSDILDTRHPQHMVSVGASYRSQFGLDANVDLHVVSGVNIPERTFDAVGNVVVASCEAPAYALLNARVGYRLLQDRLELGVTGTNLTGWATGGHREHCMGTPVGPRVMGSATYRF